MPLPTRKQRQHAKLRAQATTRDPGAGLCGWCDPRARKPTQAAAGKGLSKRMCLQHIEHHSRHGDPCKPSYKHRVLRPLENIARRWMRRTVKRGKNATHVQAAIVRARNTLLQGRDYGLTLPTNPKERAKAMLSRLYAKYCGEREAGVRTKWPRQRGTDALALDMVAIALGVALAEHFDPAPSSKTEFADTQVGKVLFRRAGGWTRRIQRTGRDGVAYLDELNRYAPSRGLALRALGRPLRDAVADVWTHHGEELRAFAENVGVPTIENWTLERLTPKRPTKGGRKPAKAYRNPVPGTSQDRIRRLSR